MPRQMTVSCPSCRQPVSAILETIIDPGLDPQAKARLLTGQVNSTRCPSCGEVVMLSAPILYHDASKELLLTYVPMELGLSKDAQERAIGELMRELTARLPNEAKKGYLFQPRQMLTMQGMIDSILQADGVTPEMLEAQKARVRLLETLLSSNYETLADAIREHDASIDAQLFQTLAVMTQRMAVEGRSDIAQRMLMLQEALVEHSTFGAQLAQANREQEAIVREVAEAVNALGENADRAAFLDLARAYNEDSARLQALVGLVRPVFDYEFFQQLTLAIGQAPAAERDRLEALRERLLQLTALVDQQAQAALQEAARLLQTIASSADPDAVIRDNLPLLDDTFMAVLAANIQEAERQRNPQLSAKLKDIYERVVDALQDNMGPELKFINALLNTASDDEARTLIAEEAAQYGEPLLEMMDAVGAMLSARGGDGAMLERLAFLRAETAAALR
ncbi:MAG: CpXC domain-containing protein [Aggregatilineales bacterium]